MVGETAQGCETQREATNRIQDSLPGAAQALVYAGSFLLPTVTTSSNASRARIGPGATTNPHSGHNMATILLALQ